MQDDLFKNDSDDEGPRKSVSENSLTSNKSSKDE